MTQIFNEDGAVTPVTLIEAGPITVTQVKTKEKDGYDAVQVGYGNEKKPNKPKVGHLKGLKPSGILKETKMLGALAEKSKRTLPRQTEQRTTNNQKQIKQDLQRHPAF